MKYTVILKTIISKRRIYSLITFVMLSIGCQGSSSSSNSFPPQPGNTQGTPVPANSQLAPTNLRTNPSVYRTEANNATKPSIEITEVPRKGAGSEVMETIAGRVSGVKIKECKVVIFARTNTWYVQPFVDSPDTSINDDNTWRTDTHLGFQYAALLVKNSYKPPSTTGKLPEVGGPVLAIATANPRQ
jgi:hypothetical protein